jgi:hypothetical protein
MKAKEPPAKDNGEGAKAGKGKKDNQLKPVD